MNAEIMGCICILALLAQKFSLVEFIVYLDGAVYTQGHVHNTEYSKTCQCTGVSFPLNSIRGPQ